MLDFNQEISFKVGDTVALDGDDIEGSIESIRVISDATLVEEFQGFPNKVVITVKFKDSVVNKRGVDIVPIKKNAYSF